MYHHLMAALRPTALDHVQRASFPTEPQAVFVYVLILLALWVIWKGHRASGKTHVDTPDGRPKDAPGSRAGPPADPHRERKKGGGDRIPWVQ